jgi:predicted DCC family thiol-disulfide oxidoreductase YuxK
MDAAVLLFDSDCGFCRWAVSKFLSWDRRGRVRPVALQSEEAIRYLPGMTEERRMASWHLVLADGRTYSAGAAAPPLLRLLPAGKGLAAILAAAPATTERVYQWTAGHRDRLGRIVGAKACSVDPSASRPGNRPG